MTAISLFFCGDVMTGRGIDQLLPHPCSPELYEPCVNHAGRYIELAEAQVGSLPRGVSYDYVWGDALAELEQRSPDVRIVNLETSVTSSDHASPKGINYRMHPENAACLSAAGIDCCVLANNHVLDWGREGLLETLDTLHRRRLWTAGAGNDLAEAAAPAVLPFPGGGRLLVFAAATGDSGVPTGWAASPSHSGVHRLADLSENRVRELARLISHYRRKGDRVLFSIHWGGNWDYGVSREQQAFARGLVDRAGVDVVHGHSSHHIKAMEVYRNRLICYGCGDFLNDYEGIGGNESYRGDLGLMYFVTLEADSGKLLKVELVPIQIRRLKVAYASTAGQRWLLKTLNRECGSFGCHVDVCEKGGFELSWSASAAVAG